MGQWHQEQLQPKVNRAPHDTLVQGQVNPELVHHMTPCCCSPVMCLSVLNTPHTEQNNYPPPPQPQEHTPEHIMMPSLHACTT